LSYSILPTDNAKQPWQRSADELAYYVVRFVARCDVYSKAKPVMLGLGLRPRLLALVLNVVALALWIWLLYGQYWLYLHMFSTAVSSRNARSWSRWMSQVSTVITNL